MVILNHLACISIVLKDLNQSFTSNCGETYKLISWITCMDFLQRAKSMPNIS